MKKDSFQPIIPFEPVMLTTFPETENWICQVKWDGVRLLTYACNGQVRLYNRKQHERTKQYPELCHLSSYCRASSVILDGEVISLVEGKPSFSQVMKRDSLKSENKIKIARQQIAITYMIFDVLYFEGEWITSKPLIERQKVLEEMIIPNDQIQIVQNFTDGDALFQAIEQQQMEGIVYKDLSSSYLIGGKDHRWIKRKVDYDLYAVVGGVVLEQGQVKSLLLGLYDEYGDLHYIGHAGTGKLSQREWIAFAKLIQPQQVDFCPFVEMVERMKGATWIQPIWVVKVKYAEWLPSNKLRQPSVQAFVEMDPAMCTFMQSAHFSRRETSTKK
jgi:bifunctional non-homologous end joining protein LigD